MKITKTGDPWNIGYQIEFKNGLIINAYQKSPSYRRNIYPKYKENQVIKTLKIDSCTFQKMYDSDILKRLLELKYIKNVEYLQLVLLLL